MIRALLLFGVILPLLAAGCSSDDNGGFDDPVVIGGEPEAVPIIAVSELVVGENRFVLGILGADGAPIADATVKLKFFDLNSGKAVEKFSTDTQSVVPARDAELTEQIEHRHPDGTRHVHINATDQIGVYVSQVRFDVPGPWGVEVAIESRTPKLSKTERVRFDVLPTSQTPALGSPAPRSRNLTASDVADISQIDSSAKPSAEMHTSTIAGAIAAGKPTLVLFAVPGFCDSRLCGPELEIMRKLYPKWKDRAEFVHVEFYKEPGNPVRVRSDAAVEWNLMTEPWFFLIDASGNIAAKFEGPTSMGELDAALQKVVR